MFRPVLVEGGGRGLDMTSDPMDAALLIIRGDPDRARFHGRKDDALIDAAETALGLRLPPSYRRFVRELGAGNYGADEFYGIIDGDFDRGGVPDGIWCTLSARAEWGLPNQYMIVGADGMGGSYAIDTSRSDATGENPVVWLSVDFDPIQILADSFGRFFLDSVVLAHGNPPS